MKKFTGIILFSFVILLISCQEKNKLQVDVSGIDTKVNIIRFDKDFYGQPVSRLPEIKKKYPFLFPPKTPDSIWKVKMQDSLFLELKKQVDSVFPDMKKYQKDIAGVFKHVKYYFPGFQEPDIITLYSDWNYMRRAVYTDSLLLLTLDNFLGSNNKIYKGIPQYIRQNMNPGRIPVEIANSIVESKVKPPTAKHFLSKMIYAGKKLYLLNALLPELPDSLIIGYSAKKMKWAKENEKNVWEYFIDKKLLYDSKNSLDMRFLNVAPYSKFYSEEDMNSPGRIGQYTGWQIVRSFMQKNDVSLQQLLQLPEEEIFKKSKYKPKR
jgi:gliding motility-associated lipoprotein GldB